MWISRRDMEAWITKANESHAGYVAATVYIADLKLRIEKLETQIESERARAENAIDSLLQTKMLPPV